MKYIGRSHRCWIITAVEVWLIADYTLLVLHGSPRTEYDPSESDVAFVGAMGILGVLCYGTFFVGSLAFMAFSIYAFQAGKPGDLASGYYLGRLSFYSLLLIIVGLAQLMLGSYVLRLVVMSCSASFDVTLLIISVLEQLQNFLSFTLSSSHISPVYTFCNKQFWFWSASEWCYQCCNVCCLFSWDLCICWTCLCSKWFVWSWSLLQCPAKQSWQSHIPIFHWIPVFVHPCAYDYYTIFIVTWGWICCGSSICCLFDPGSSRLARLFGLQGKDYSRCSFLCIFRHCADGKGSDSQWRHRSWNAEWFHSLNCMFH